MIAKVLVLVRHSPIAYVDDLPLPYRTEPGMFVRSRSPACEKQLVVNFLTECVIQQICELIAEGDLTPVACTRGIINSPSTP
jgi:hypothetical protein